ncbi:cytochrome c oxidase assembly protein [Streptomyces cavourensis]
MRPAAAGLRRRRDPRPRPLRPGRGSRRGRAGHRSGRALGGRRLWGGRIPLAAPRDAWPWWRDASFTAGSAGLAWVAVGSLPGGALTAHMAQHLVVGMAAPLLFVLARPLTLALRALAPSAARRGLVALAHSRAVGWLVFPPWRPCWMSGVCGCCTAVACSPPCSTTRGCTRWSTYTF